MKLVTSDKGENEESLQLETLWFPKNEKLPFV